MVCLSTIPAMTGGMFHGSQHKLNYQLQIEHLIMTTQATVTKLEWNKDENGNHAYDQKAIEKYRDKQYKLMERQNKKIEKGHSEGRMTDLIICDPSKFADMVVRMYSHHFRSYTEKVTLQ